MQQDEAWAWTQDFEFVGQFGLESFLSSKESLPAARCVRQKPFHVIGRLLKPAGPRKP